MEFTPYRVLETRNDERKATRMYNPRCGSRLPSQIHSVQNLDGYKGQLLWYSPILHLYRLRIKKKKKKKKKQPLISGWEKNNQKKNKAWQRVHGPLAFSTQALRFGNTVNWMRLINTRLFRLFNVVRHRPPDKTAENVRNRMSS